MDEISESLMNNSWSLSSEENMNVFSIPKLEVTTTTRIYEKDGVSSTVGLEMPVFLFVSKLEFSSEVPPSGMKLIRGIVKNESKNKFTDILKHKGLEEIKVTNAKNQSREGRRIDLFSYVAKYIHNDKKYEIKSECYVFHNGDNYYILGYSKPLDNSILVSNSGIGIQIDDQISEIVDLIL